MNTYTSEKRIQAEAFQRAWNLYPQTRRLIFHVENEAPDIDNFIIAYIERIIGKQQWINTLKSILRKKKAIYLNQRKAKGVVEGIPDMLFIWEGKPYAFEFKTSNGKLSQAQMKVHTTWTDHEAAPFIVRSPDEFVSLIGKIIGNN